MDLALPDSAVQFADSARRALRPWADNVGTRDRLSSKETADAAHAALAAIGTWTLDVGEDFEQCLAAVLAAVECGRVAVALPVAALLAAQATGVSGQVHAVAEAKAGAPVLLDHARGRVRVIDHEGRQAEAEVTEDPRSSRLLAPDMVRAVVGEPAATDPWGWAMHELFSASVSLGAAEAAVEHSRTHLSERRQFGKPLAAFQALQHRFADASRGVSALREMVRYTAWRLHVRRGNPVSDALALRVCHLETVREVFRHAHQVHGALGFCYEHPIAVLSTSVQFARYSPLTETATLRLLGGRLRDIDLIFRSSTVDA